MGGRAKGSGKGRQDGRSLDVGAMDIRTRTTAGGEEPAVAEPHRMGGAGQGGVKQYNKANKLPHRMRRNGSYFGRLNVSVFLIYLWCYLLLIMAASGGSNNVVNGLKCYCNPKECDVIRSLDCPGKGLMLWDPCKCCRICAKTLGESCGGPGGFSGQCEPPLQCVTKLPISSGLGVCMGEYSTGPQSPERGGT
ncbi:GL12759 [Drosophila persimilis]|uniref:GL12759 n=1 Tax=Drosophila persimilis TaxID=7234 RepID=B4H7R2_DROPE|nr:GL12759 [Drosophila persimilis]